MKNEKSTKKVERVIFTVKIKWFDKKIGKEIEMTTYAGNAKKLKERFNDIISNY